MIRITFSLEAVTNMSSLLQALPFVVSVDFT
jgi:hypothetical protein